MSYKTKNKLKQNDNDRAIINNQLMIIKKIFINYCSQVWVSRNCSPNASDMGI